MKPGSVYNFFRVLQQSSDMVPDNIDVEILYASDKKCRRYYRNIKHIDKFAELMKAGKWTWTPDNYIRVGKEPSIYIFDGSHRVAAARIAGISKIPVVWIDSINKDPGRCNG